MISLMLVAGDQSKKLAEHLTNNGAFKAEYVLQNLADNQEQLKSSIIKVDKLLYVFRPDQMNIRTEMAILKDLFLSESYFEVNSVVFIQSESEEARTASNYFNTTMQECNTKARYGNVLDYELYTIKGDLTFNVIKNTVLSITQINNKKNTVANFVRYEKNNKASTAYDPTNTRNHKVEPFDYSSVVQYEREQKNSISLETGTIKHTSGDSMDKTLSNPSVASIQLAVQKQIKSYIITGAGKSGKSTIAAALAKSTVMSGESILILDMTHSNSIKTKLESAEILHRVYTPAQLITNQFDAFDGMTVCSLEDREIIKDFISVFYTSIIEKIIVDNVLIIVDISDFSDIACLVGIDLTDSFVCMHPLITDTLLTSKINECEFCKRIGNLPTLILNKNLSLHAGEKWLDPKEVKQYYPKNRVIAHLQVNSFNLDDTLHNKILNREIKNE